MSTLVTCATCGWVHFVMPRAAAEEHVRKFNEFYDRADNRTQRMCGRRADIVRYEHCGRCGAHYTTFRAHKAGDCPDGCTLPPIIKD